MKKWIVTLYAIAAVTMAQAQPEKPWGNTVADSVSCWENLNIAGSYYKNKSYAQAYESWYQLYTTCPGASKNTYIIAPKVIESKIAEEQDAAKKKELADILIRQYDDRLKYFPEKEGYVRSEKAADYQKYNKDDYQTAYQLFQEAFEVAGNDMYPSQLNSYFISTIRMFNAKEIGFDALLEDYNFITDALDYNIVKYDKLINEAETAQEAGECDAKCEKSLSRNKRIIDGYAKVQGNIEKMLAPLLSCDRLDLIYTEEKFEEHEADAKWLYIASKMLSKERSDEEGNKTDCTSNPMFLKISEALYEIEPSAQAARNIGIIAYKNKDYSKASTYFDEAVNLEEDNRKKGDDLLKSATCQQRLGNLSNAKSLTLKAAKLQKNWGAPYVLLASIYADAAGTCGKDAVEKKGVYWAAIDKLNYAKSIDPEIASRANKLISVYKKAVPDKSTAFALGYKEGDPVKLGCWINENVVVKFY
jgi:tetratricopeptide (TPR) repeat protein